MAHEAGGRERMPPSAMITPVLMLVAGVAASVGLWMLLNEDGVPVRGRGVPSMARIVDAGHSRP